MKKLKLKIFLLSLISLLLILSCSVISSSDDDETYFPITQETLGSSFITKTSVVNGKFDFSGAIPNEISLILAQTQNQDARSACPDYDVYSKFVVASTEGQSDIAGVVNADNTFSITIPYGTWTIKAGLKKGDAIICSSEQNITVVSDSITLPSFNMTSMQSANGSVDLEMIIDSSIRSFTATCISPTPSSWDGTSICSLASGELTIKTDSLTSGCYIVEFCFYETSTTNGDLAYSTTQAINVFDNLCTNKWVASAYESNISSDGTFSITAENISNFHLTTLYVDGGTSNAIESGTWLTPCKTVARAVQKCNLKEEYTIYVSGTTAETDQIAPTKKCNFIGMGTSPTIGRASSSSGYLMKVSSGNTVNITGININCSLGSSKMPGIQVFGTLNVTDSTIENCQNSQQGGAINNSIGTVTLTNSTVKNCSSTQNGGAIYSSGNLSLVNSKIQSNTATSNGGGIYVDGGRTTIDSTSCIGDSTAISKSTSSNKSNSASSGGGVYVESGTFTLNGTLAYNYAAQNGGGAYFATGITPILENATVSLNTTAQKGGNIYNNGSLTIKGTSKIEGGQATFGGGIYSVGTINFEAGIIGNTKTDDTLYQIDNTATSQGGCIYLDSIGTLNMSAGTIIGHGFASGSGGGIYACTTNNTGTNIAGTIQYCRANSMGGGICTSTLAVGAGRVKVKLESTALINYCKTTGATSSSGGIHLSKDADLTMLGGAITNCSTYTSKGDGVYLDKYGTFEISGDAQLDATSTIYLKNDAKLNITGTLSQTEVATIKTENLPTDSTNIPAIISTNTLTHNIAKKFAYADENYYLRYVSANSDCEVYKYVLEKNCTSFNDINNYIKQELGGGQYYADKDVVLNIPSNIDLGRETIRVNTDSKIAESITIKGASASSKSQLKSTTTSQSYPVINFSRQSTTNAVIFENLIIDGNNKITGIETWIPTVKMKNCIVQNCSYQGGAKFTTGTANIELENVEIKNCNKTYNFYKGAGGLSISTNSRATVSLNNVYIHDCKADGDNNGGPGGLFFYCSITGYYTTTINALKVKNNTSEKNIGNQVGFDNESGLTNGKPFILSSPNVDIGTNADSDWGHY